jgi:hypothetical protein
MLDENQKYDDVLLAENTPFQLAISRMKPELLTQMESLLIPALIEELMQVKRRVEELEKKSEN